MLSAAARLFLLSVLATACAEAPPSDAPITVTDAAGRVVQLDSPAQRVVSMVPAVTDWIIAVGAADRLVARTDYDHHPVLDTLPSLGGGLTPSLEWLAARRPDLVVSWPDAPSRSIVGRIEEIGIATYAASSETIAGAFEIARDVGLLLGREQTADSAVTAVRAALDSVRALVADRPRPSVLYLIGLDPLMAAGPGTFIDELITTAGGANVLADLGMLWPQVSLEEVVRRNPDVVVVGAFAADDLGARLRGRLGWRDVAAVRNGRVHAVDPNVVNRWGPGLAEAARLLATALHPEVGAP